MYSAVVQEFRENNKLKTTQHKEIKNNVEINKKKDLQSFLNTLV